MQDIDIINLLTKEDNIILILLAFVSIVFFIESYKFLKYKTRSEILDLSLMGVVFFGTYYPPFFRDLFLSVLSAMLVLMIIGVYELREAPVWVRLMGAFTLSYAYVLVALLLEKLVVSQGWATIWGLKATQITGIALSTLLWVLLIFLVLFFGKKFILVSRFLSPQYVYLFLYTLVYLTVSQFELDPMLRYPLIMIVNALIYLSSGYLLTFIFGIKPLEDERALKLMEEVKGKVKTPVKRIGIVNAPIINAFAYGPWFDQRIAFIVKDIDDFKDEEILGIATHELAHLKHKHTLLLLFIGWIDLIFRLIMGIPVSVFDFAADYQNTNPGLLAPLNIEWNIPLYYVINIGIFAIMLIFVRIFEGQADRTTINAGYGNELGKSLYKLEGFYQGIAGEIGMNAQLLTDKKRTIPEEKRFMGDAANELHDKLMNAPRYGLFMNLIVSHPPTVFRIAAIMQPDKISILKLALMPFLLIIPGFRGRNLKYLRSQSDDLSRLLTEKYKTEWNEVESFRSTTYLKTTYGHFSKKHIIAENKYNPIETPIIGTVEEILSNDNIIEPYLLRIRTGTEEMNNISLKKYNIKIFEPNSWYVLNNLLVAKLELYEMKKKKINFIYSLNDKKIKINYLGEPLENIFSLKKPFVYHSRGKSSLINIQEINQKPMMEFFESFNKSESFDNNIKNWKIKGVDYITKEEMNFNGKNLIISTPPLFIPFYKRFKDKNIEFIDSLAGEKIPVTLYSSIDPDIGIPCTFSLEKDEVKYQIPGDPTFFEIKMKHIDGMVLRYPNFLFLKKNENGFFTRIFMRLSNRSSMKYSL
jgi:Zn-dependent protease with chaperone function